MKKWIITGTVLLFILLIALPFILIPKSLLVSETIKVNLKSTSAFRSLLNESNWYKWWPSDEMKKDGPKLIYRGSTYKINEHFYNAIGIDILRGNRINESRINIIPVNVDSVFLVWGYEVQSSLNPFIRIKQYKESTRSKKDLSIIMQHMQAFLNKQENIYGLDIHVEMSRDTTLISTKFNTGNYPSTADIYQAIEALRRYIQNNSAREANYPMLHVDRVSDHYESMVAIPVNKALKSKGKFEFKRFVPWKVLTAEVKGGDSSIKQGFNQFNIFIQDYNLLQMANSFESLVTDRSREKDTSKWITRFYTPIP